MFVMIAQCCEAQFFSSIRITQVSTLAYASLSILLDLIHIGPQLLLKKPQSGFDMPAHHLARPSGSLPGLGWRQRLRSRQGELLHRAASINRPSRVILRELGA
jgi:hypothetical protein